MIHIQPDDTIIDIIDKIESQNQEEIILDFPLGHPILHNYISLKILKSKVGEKKLVIATNDRIGRKLGKRLGIEYSSVKNSTFIKEGAQNILMQHNFTFLEYFKFQVKSYIKEIQASLDANKKINSIGKYSKVYQEKTSIHIFLIALISSGLLLAFIYYFAVSKTYISISPEISIKKEAYNFIIKESIGNDILGNNKYIKANNISESIHLSEIYTSSAIQNNSRDIAQGKVKLFNTLPDAVTLKINTRLQNKEGIVLELKNWVTIPAGIKDNFGKISPGTVEADAQAQTKDARGNFTGARGNIKSNTDLILPGLDSEGQKDIYAVTTDDFTGGVDDVKKVVSQSDIENARTIFGEKLKNEVLKYVKNNIYEQNKLNHTKIDILTGEKSIRYSAPEIFLEPGVQSGSLQDTFSLTGSISINLYTFNKENIIQKLKTIIYEKNLEGVEKISQIDESSLRMSEIVSTQEKPFEMKATFEIESLYLHDFLHKQNTYIEQLKEKIRGLPQEEATKILLNDPKISNVKIEIRPFFSHKVSPIANNIIFKVE